MINAMKKSFFCFSMELDEERKRIYTGGNKSRVLSFPEQTVQMEMKGVKNCSPYLSPNCTHVMFFNDPSYMYLYRTDQLERCLYRGKFKPSGSNAACWRDDACFLFASEGALYRVVIHENDDAVEAGVWIDLREIMGNPDAQITSVDCDRGKVLLFVRRWIPGSENCVVEIDETDAVRIRELGKALSDYDDVRYDRKGGVFYSNRVKDMAWCETIDHTDKADAVIENVKSYCTRVSADGRYLAVGIREGADSGAMILETRAFSIRRRFEYKLGRWGRVGFSSGGQYALIGGSPAQIVDVRDLEEECGQDETEQP